MIWIGADISAGRGTIYRRSRFKCPARFFCPPALARCCPAPVPPARGFFIPDHALWFPAGSGYREGSAAAPRSKPMLPVFCRARDDHMGGLCPIGMTKTFRRRHLPKRSYGVICGSLSRSDRFRNTRNLCGWPGVTRPSTQLRRHL
jgi:hypothetical protein